MIILNNKEKENSSLIKKTEYLIDSKHVKDTYIDEELLLKMLKISNEYSRNYMAYHRPIKENLENLKKIYLDKDTIISLAREVIESINIDYLKEYDSFVYSKRIGVKNPKIKEILAGPIEPGNRNKYIIFGTLYNKTEYIEICRCYNYIDVVNLVHEFMHHTNSYDVINNIKLRNKLTEYISVYFEFYTIKYLMDNKNIKSEYIDSSWRIRSTERLTDYIYSLIIPYIYKNNGYISYDLFEKYIIDNKLLINPECINYYLKKVIDIICSKDTFNECLCNSSKYIKGTILSFSNKELIDKSYLLELNNMINNKKYNHMKIDTLKDIYNNIDSDETIYKYMDEYINNYVRVKK